MINIKIYTDGSFQKNKAGISFLIINPGKNKILGYTNLKCKKNIQAELQAIIHALQYLLYIDMSLEDKEIEIVTDEISIVEVFSSQKYKIWDSCQWKKENGRVVIKCTKEWFILSCLVKKIGDMVMIRFSKTSKDDSQNKVVHGFANYARKLQFCKKNSVHILEAENNEDFVFKETVDVSENREVKEILNIGRPWKSNKNKADFKWYIERQHEIVYIDTHDIIITEEIHLNCNSLNFGTLFRTAAESQEISYPIAVRPLENGKYSLVAGITRLITAKLFNIPMVPCVITHFTNEEFIKQNLVNVGGNN
ncbi:ribonuclease HI [Lutispora thermophila]|uniref:Ribonuclease HI n=1 Tax=Lutispora thermophila DSM 19022 TaxID=1122184 RepID=A0A1M6GWT6_9FIRM|nr:RNase H family protein [Lutispora thermophila]SHJ14394.1 Ribonuclease HI [Lutispora thermophila DSM 19022]